MLILALHSILPWFTLSAFLAFNLMCSYSNVLFIINFIGLLFVFGFLLFAFNLISVAVFMLLIYATIVSLLFLINGLLLMSSFSYVYCSLSPCSLINWLDFDASLALPCQAFNSATIYLSAFHFHHLSFLSSYSPFLNAGISRLSNVMFDNSMVSLLSVQFCVNICNLNVMFLVILSLAYL